MKYFQSSPPLFSATDKTHCRSDWQWTARQSSHHTHVTEHTHEHTHEPINVSLPYWCAHPTHETRAQRSHMVTRVLNIPPPSPDFAKSCKALPPDYLSHLMKTGGLKQKRLRQAQGFTASACHLCGARRWINTCPLHNLPTPAATMHRQTPQRGGMQPTSQQPNIFKMS